MILCPLEAVTISWVYESDIANIEQSGYELKISDNSINWGKSSFSGNKFAIPMMTDKSLSYRINQKFLDRGVTYYGQIRIKDIRNKVSAWYRFSFAINRLPSLTSLTIQPLLPNLNDNINIQYSTSADTVSTKIRWYRNGVHMIQLDNFATLPSDHLYYNDTWYAEVTPFDGLEYGETGRTNSVKMIKQPPLAKNIRILPSFPNVDDILEADFTSVDGVTATTLTSNNKIEWYVNNQLITNAIDKKFLRVDFKPNDEVYFIVTPYDGITYGSSKRSAVVNINPKNFVVDRILIDGAPDNTAVRSLNPIISWSATDSSQGLPRYTRLVIGTISGFNNIHSVTVPYENLNYRIPDNILKSGLDYFLGLSFSNIIDKFPDAEVVKFRVVGDLWNDTVSNSNGWTLAIALKLENPTPTPNPPLEDQYFTLNICDGARQVFLRFYDNRVVLYSEANRSQSFNISNLVYNNFTIVGKGDTIKVYHNNNLIIDGTNKYKNASEQKILQLFSDAFVLVKCYVKNLSYTTAGYFEIGSSAYNVLGLQKILQLEGKEITDMQVFDGNIVLSANPTNVDLEGQIYKITEVGTTNNRRFSVRNVDRKPFVLNNIFLSPQNNNIQISHSLGSTTFTNYFIGDFDSNSNFVGGSTPANTNWELIRTTSFDAASFIDDGLIIDTTIGERQFEISQDPLEVVSRQNIEAISFISLYNSVLSYEFELTIDNNKLIIFLRNQNIVVYEANLQTFKLQELVDELNSLNKSENYFFSLYYTVYINNSSISSQAASGLNKTPRSVLFPSLTINGLYEVHDVYNQSPYGTLGTGKWYYAHRKKGTPWFDLVDNEKGWTIDFSARVDKIEDSSTPSNIDDIKSIGFYINDGTMRDTIWLLSQEIICESQKKSLPIDATRMNDYRIIGRNNRFKIFAKPNNSPNYTLLHEYVATQKATKQGNAGRPCIFTDSLDNKHAVWHDDGNGVNRRQIFYSKLSRDATEWSEPEIVVDEDISVNNPQIVVDKKNTIYVVYETSKVDFTDISVKTKNTDAWSDATLLSSGLYNSLNPQIITDEKNNVHIIWEDYRNIQPQIFYAYRDASNGQWYGDTPNDIIKQVTKEPYGAKRPSICYNNNILYVSYTGFMPDGSTNIKITTYNVATKQWYSDASNGIGYLVSALGAVKPDNSDIVNNNSGQVFVVWQEKIQQNIQIMSRVVSDRLIYAQNIIQLTTGFYDSTNPSCGLEEISNDVYLVFEKIQENFETPQNNQNQDTYEYDESTTSVTSIDYQAMQSKIFICKYVMQEKKWYSSNQNTALEGLIPFDVQILFRNEKIAYRPKISKYFSGNMHILFESLEAVRPKNKIDHANLFTQIRDAVYNLNFVPRHRLDSVLPYGEVGGELSLVGELNRKELRFGDFSDSTSGKITIGKIQYYTKDAVEPFSINLVSNVTTNLPNVNVLASVANNAGDAWIGTDKGLFYYQKSLRANFELTDTEYNVGRGSVRKIVFDRYQNMFLIIDGKIKMSFDHSYFYTLIGDPSTNLPVTAIDIAFDALDRMYVVSNEGLFVIRMQKIYATRQLRAADINVARNITVTNSDLQSKFNRQSGLITQNLTCVVVDAANVVWIGSDRGLLRFQNGNFATFRETNGLSSDKINAITIRNTAIRYIATDRSIDKMVGMSINSLTGLQDSLPIATLNGNIVDDRRFPPLINCKAIHWKNPNLLFLAVNNDVYQIVFLDEAYQTDSIKINKFTPLDYAFFDETATRDENTITYTIDIRDLVIPDNVVYEVLLNGNKITRGFVYNAKMKILKFLCPLLPTDQISVNVRFDVELLSNFRQNKAESLAVGKKTTRLERLLQSNNKIVALTAGDYNTLQINDDLGNLPFDKIIIDRKPPKGKITIDDRIDGTNYIVKIDPIFDPYAPNQTVEEAFDEVSGVDKMIVSNFPNFTSDGETPLDPINFARSIIHNIGSSFTTANKEYTIPSGKGRRLGRHTPTTGSENLYFGTSSPANIYKYNPIDGGWFLHTSFELVNDVPNINSAVEFIVSSGGAMYVGVSTINGVAKVYKLNELTDRFEIFITIDRASHPYCAIDNAGILYIGAGGPAPKVGSITAVEGTRTRIFADNISNAVYSLVLVDEEIYAGTGSEGRIYKFTLEPNVTQSIVDINSDRDCISIAQVELELDTYVFAGFATNGLIKKSKIPDEAFAQSFRTLQLKVAQLKPIYGVLHAAIGNNLYAYEKVWTSTHVHSENIEDFMAISELELFYISDNYIYKLDKNIDSKRVYLKLIDRVGNETSLYTDTAQTKLDPNLFDELSIEVLQNIINTNKIIRCDDFGRISTIRTGSDDFYSADFIDEESGEYFSEIFNGANNFVSWDRISWDATIPANTFLSLEIRSGRTRDEIMLASFSLRIDGTEKSADISFLSGQFIQFKIKMRTRTRNLSPSVRSIVIKSVNTDSAHFFTTNFVLPSRMKSGILTSTKLIPMAADVIFGINTNNSVDFTEYQLIDENRIFTTDNMQIGDNLRIGIKLISPSKFTPSDFIPEYGPYAEDVTLNSLDWIFRNDTSKASVVNFLVEFYADEDKTSLVYTADTQKSFVGFSINQEIYPTNGAFFEINEEATIAYTPLGETPITCNTNYYVVIKAKTDQITKTIKSDILFYQTCATTYVDSVSFDYFNTTDISEVYHFRIRFFNNAERTDLKYTAFSGNDVANWSVDNLQMTPTGATINPNDSVAMEFVPTKENLTASKIYYISIDVYDGLKFVNVSSGLTFVLNPFDEKISCGNISNVPVVKSVSLMFETDNNEFVNLREDR